MTDGLTEGPASTENQANLEGLPGRHVSELAELERSLSVPQRQSPMGLVFKTVKVVRNLQGFNVAVLAAFVFARQLGSLLMTGIILVVLLAAVWSLIWWWKFVFRVQDGRLLVDKGVFAQERLDIPLNRVQSVSIDQPWLHRLLGLVRVSVETAGTSAVEFEIDAVSESVAHSLQKLAEGYGAGGTAGSDPTIGLDQPPGFESEEEMLIARSFSELFKAAVSRLPLAGLVGLGSLFPFSGRIIERVEEFNLGSSLRTIIPLVIIVGVLIWSANVAQEVVRNWSLTLTRSRVGLRRSAGLFSRTSKSTTVERVQALRTTQNWLERRFGICRVAMPTIGSGDLHIPGCSLPEEQRFRELLFGNGEAVPAQNRVSAWMVYRDARALPLLLAASVAATVILDTAWPLLGIALSAWILVVAVLRWRMFRWEMLADRVVVCSGILTRTRTEQQLIKGQVAAVSSGFFERRRDLAGLVVRSAEGRTTIPMIDRVEAERLRDFVLATLATNRTPWM